MVDLDRLHQRLELLDDYLRELRIASEGWRAPRDFGDSFTVLHECGVIDDALAGRLRGLAGLRNRLVHVYDEIDDVRVHEALTAGLADLDAFATAVARLAS